MTVVLSFTPCGALLEARRRRAPRARFDREARCWTMDEAEYAAFWMEALSLRRDRMIVVHSVGGRRVAG